MPAFLAEYAGDTLWALLVFLLVSSGLAGRPLTLRTATAIVLSFLVEIGHLYHAPWIDSIRQTTLGGLVLGFGLLWSDLICYSVGIAIGFVAESAIVAKMKHGASDGRLHQSAGQELRDARGRVRSAVQDGGA